MPYPGGPGLYPIRTAMSRSRRPSPPCQQHLYFCGTVYMCNQEQPASIFSHLCARPELADRCSSFREKFLVPSSRHILIPSLITEPKETRDPYLLIPYCDIAPHNTYLAFRPGICLTAPRHTWWAQSCVTCRTNHVGGRWASSIPKNPSRG